MGEIETIMATLAEQFRALAQGHTDIKELLRDQSARLDNIEQRAVAACRGCDLRVPLKEAVADIRLLEKDMAGMTGKAAGISIAAGALSFLAAWFTRK